MSGGARTALRARGAGARRIFRSSARKRSAWALRLADSHLSAKAHSAWGRRCPVYRTAGNGKAVWPYGNAVNRSAGRAATGRSESPPTSPAHLGSRERDRWSSAGQPAAKPIKALTHRPANAPQEPGRAVFGSTEHARGRGIDGPTQGSPRPKAVERSADRRGTVDSSPFHTQEKESGRVPIMHAHLDIGLPT